MLVMKLNKNPLIIEEFRALKTRLEYCSIDKKIKSLVLTSSNPGEGKSTITGNLAYALAQNDIKVIVIDCDLRRPTIHKKFKISNEKGLTDILVGKVSLEEATIKVEKNIHVITSGAKAPNPVEVLGSKALEYLIETLGRTYDYILFDTPPVKNISDAQVLSAKVDATILVVKSDATKSKDVLLAYKALESVRANIIGVVMNYVKKKKIEYYY